MTHPLAIELLPFVILPNQNHSVTLQLISFGGLVSQAVWEHERFRGHGIASGVLNLELGS
jgi:hypothetical protein